MKKTYRKMFLALIIGTYCPIFSIVMLIAYLKTSVQACLYCFIAGLVAFIICWTAFQIETNNMSKLEAQLKVSAKSNHK